MYFEKNAKLICIGDSITDCGRDAVGEANCGLGYVRQFGAMLDAFHPEVNLRIINRGVSGNTSRQMAARWQEDVLAHKPDYVSIMIGVNDAWRLFDSPRKTEDHVSLEELETTLGGLIADFLKTGKGVILLTPFFVDTNQDEPLRKAIEARAVVVRSLAQKHNCLLIDTQQVMDEQMRKVHPMQVSGDRVHPTYAGHCLIARAMLDAIGFDWNHR